MQIFILITFLALAQSSALGEDKVKLFLKWKHQFQFAGYYAAKEKGFFKEEGLSVELIERDIAWNAPEKVSDKPGHYGVSDSSIVKYFLEDKEFIIVAPIFQHSPLVLATRAEDQILGPAGLKGKKVMYQKGVDDAVFSVMFNNYNVSPDEFTYVPHSFNSNDLIEKKVDAISVYQTNQTFYFEKRNIKINILNPLNYGVDLYGDMLFTNTREASLFPERVKAMRRAVIKGWYYALNNEEEIVNLILEKYNKEADFDQLIYEANETKKFIEAHNTPIGHISILRLERIANIYGVKNKKALENLENIIFDNYVKKSNSTLSPKFLRTLFVVLFILTILVIIALYFSWKLKKEVEKKTLHIKNQQEQKDLFFSKLTHELRTPLNAITGSVFFLKDLEKSEEVDSYVKIIDQSSDNLLGLVNDILDFNKLEMKKVSLVREPTSLQSVIKECLTVHQIACQKKGIQLDSSFNKQEDIYIQLDILRFKQILNNLLSNAVKFTTKGSVVVNCSYTEKEDDQYVIEVEVIDTGIGISSEKMETVFNPFEQADEKINSQYGGTGLGLGITKEIVQLFDGEISVSKNSPQGSIFKFSILCKKSSLQSNEKVEEKIINIPCDLKVLVVDDNNLNILVLTKYLQKLGLSSTSASNGAEALKKLENEHFDLLILDKLMPIMDGPETAKRIRTHKKKSIREMYIIGNSANWSNGLDSECEKLQMNASLAKPIKFDQLKKVISDYLEKTKPCEQREKNLKTS